MSNPELGVLTEDLNAALSVASRLQQRGLSVAVMSGMHENIPDVQALVIDMDIDNAIDDPAGLAATWARWLRGHGCERLEVRFDSAFRGSPAACLEGFVLGSGFSSPLVLIVPAYPSAGRMCIEGSMIVPSSLGPSLTLGVPQSILHGQGAAVTIGLTVMTSGVDAVVDAVLRHERAGSRFIVFDATTAEHLSVAATATERLSRGDRQVLTASSGGWLRYFPDLDSDGFLVVAAPAAHESDQRQLTQLADAYGRRAIVMTADDVLVATQKHLGQVTSEYRIVVLTGTQGQDVDPWITAANLGAAVRRILDITNLGFHRCLGVITSGGITTGRVIKSLEATDLRPGQELEPLCPAVRVHGGPHSGMAIISKASGVGTDETMLRLAGRILGD